MNELKPCPFCGNEVEVEKIPLWYGNGHGYSGCYEFKIKCENCGCTVNQPKNDSIYRSEEEARENAIKAWNRRMPSAQLEIIHCEHCRHGVHSGRGDIYLCVVSPEELSEHKYDFFCGYGERK